MAFGPSILVLRSDLSRVRPPVGGAPPEARSLAARGRVKLEPAIGAPRGYRTAHLPSRSCPGQGAVEFSVQRFRPRVVRGRERETGVGSARGRSTTRRVHGLMVSVLGQRAAAISWVTRGQTWVQFVKTKLPTSTCREGPDLGECHRMGSTSENAASSSIPWARLARPGIVGPRPAPQPR